jgi:hypothetical protein
MTCHAELHKSMELRGLYAGSPTGGGAGVRLWDERCAVVNSQACYNQLFGIIRITGRFAGPSGLGLAGAEP